MIWAILWPCFWLWGIAVAFGQDGGIELRKYLLQYFSSGSLIHLIIPAT